MKTLLGRTLGNPFVLVAVFAGAVFVVSSHLGFFQPGFVSEAEAALPNTVRPGQSTGFQGSPPSRTPFSPDNIVIISRPEPSQP